MRSVGKTRVVARWMHSRGQGWIVRCSRPTHAVHFIQSLRLRNTDFQRAHSHTIRRVGVPSIKDTEGDRLHTWTSPWSDHIAIVGVEPLLVHSWFLGKPVTKVAFLVLRCPFPLFILAWDCMNEALVLYRWWFRPTELIDLSVVWVFFSTKSIARHITALDENHEERLSSCDASVFNVRDDRSYWCVNVIKILTAMQYDTKFSHRSSGIFLMWVWVTKENMLPWGPRLRRSIGISWRKSVNDSGYQVSVNCRSNIEAVHGSMARTLRLYKWWKLLPYSSWYFFLIRMLARKLID